MSYKGIRLTEEEKKLMPIEQRVDRIETLFGVFIEGFDKSNRRRAVWKVITEVIAFVCAVILTAFFVELKPPLMRKYVVNSKSVTQINYYLFQTEIVSYEIDYGDISSNAYWRLNESERPNIYYKEVSRIKGTKVEYNGEAYITAGSYMVSLDNILLNTNEHIEEKVLLFEVMELKNYVFASSLNGEIVDFSYLGYEK